MTIEFIQIHFTVGLVLGLWVHAVQHEHLTFWARLTTRLWTSKDSIERWKEVIHDPFSN